MPVYKYNNPTKDGRCWLFRVNYKDSLNNNRRYTSKKYATKIEAKETERKFLNELAIHFLAFLPLLSRKLT